MPESELPGLGVCKPRFPRAGSHRSHLHGRVQGRWVRELVHRPGQVLDPVCTRVLPSEDPAGPSVPAFTVDAALAPCSSTCAGRGVPSIQMKTPGSRGMGDSNPGPRLCNRCP